MTETIILGGREFRLKPLTLGQLRPLLDALDAVSGAGGRAMIDAAARILHAGLAAAPPLGLIVATGPAIAAAAAVFDLDELRERNRALAAAIARRNTMAGGTPA